MPSPKKNTFIHPKLLLKAPEVEKVGKDALELCVQVIDLGLGTLRISSTGGLNEYTTEVKQFAPEKMVLGRRSGFLLGFGNFSGANC